MNIQPPFFFLQFVVQLDERAAFINVITLIRVCGCWAVFHFIAQFIVVSLHPPSLNVILT